MKEDFKQYFDICKINNDKRIVIGKALVPDKVDSQDDIVSKDEIENVAHNFLINLQKAYVELLNGYQKTKPGQIGYMHKVFKGVGGFGYIVESYIDSDGSWVLGTKVTDDKIWKMIKDKEITGYSIGGKAKRIPQKGGEIIG